MISLFKEGNYKLKKTLHKIQVCNCMYHLCSIIHFFSETILKTSTSEGIILHADKITSISSTTNIPSALITNSFEFNDYSRALPTSSEVLITPRLSLSQRTQAPAIATAPSRAYTTGLFFPS